MKTLFSTLAFIIASASLASAAPVNDKCPVAGKPVKANCTTTYEGKEVAFCCGNCKSKFEADPKKFAAKLK